MTLANPISAPAGIMSSQPHTRARNASYASRPQRPGPVKPPHPLDGNTRDMWRRPLKVIIMLLAFVCASSMSCFAYAHGRHMRRDKWVGPYPGTTPPEQPRDPGTLLFFIASMSFTALAYAYYSSNRGDVHQCTILTSGIVLGLTMALAMDIGILLGLFGLEPWCLLMSLVLSDFFHLICVRRQRYEECVSGQEFCDEKTGPEMLSHNVQIHDMALGY